MKILIVSLLPLLMFISSCSAPGQVAKNTERDPSGPDLMARQTLSSGQNRGSLWRDQGQDMFTDLRARRVGDLLTVAIYEKASATKEATTETDRSSQVKASLSKFFGLEDKLGTNVDPTALIDASVENAFAGGGTTTRKEDLVATISTRVVAVQPNGLLEINGTKSVTVNKETQLIRLQGVVRQSDISPDNMVDSKHVLDARIAYTGKGVLTDKQSPGWLVRLMDNVWPF